MILNIVCTAQELEPICGAMRRQELQELTEGHPKMKYDTEGYRLAHICKVFSREYDRIIQRKVDADKEVHRKHMEYIESQEGKEVNND